MVQWMTPTRYSKAWHDNVKFGLLDLTLSLLITPRHKRTQPVSTTLGQATRLFWQNTKTFASYWLHTYCCPSQASDHMVTVIKYYCAWLLTAVQLLVYTRRLFALKELLFWGDSVDFLMMLNLWSIRGHLLVSVLLLATAVFSQESPIFGTIKHYSIYRNIRKQLF